MELITREKKKEEKTSQSWLLRTVNYSNILGPFIYFELSLNISVYTKLIDYALFPSHLIHKGNIEATPQYFTPLFKV